MIVFELDWESFRKIAQVEMKQIYHKIFKDRVEVYMVDNNILLRSTLFLENNTKEELENIKRNFLQHSIQLIDIFDHIAYKLELPQELEELPQETKVSNEENEPQEENKEEQEEEYPKLDITPQGYKE